MATARQYKKGIVTFLDILGFKDVLPSKSPDEICDLLRIFQSEGDPKSGVDDDFDSMFEYTALSDCFFRTAETDHKANRQYPTGHLFHELVSVIYLQCRMLQEGYLVRGAITHGNYYSERGVGGSVLFGPAVARAYELESKYAKYPRIIIDPVLIEQYWQTKLLKSVIHNHCFEWEEYLSKRIRRDEHGIWFVDYIRGITGEFDDEPEGTGMFYWKHRNFVTDKIAAWIRLKKEGPDSVSEKLHWLLQYHNSSMKLLGDDDWECLLSAEDCSLKKEDFFVLLPDHPLFREYSPTRVPGSFGDALLNSHNLVVAGP